MTENPVSPAIKLPCLLFATQHTLDDYGAPDMQYGNGSVFSDPLLDRAMAEHSSMNNFLEFLSERFTQYNMLTSEGKVAISIGEISKQISQTRLPKFNNTLDRINSLGITVHDIWATNIYLDSFEVKNDSYVASIRFNFQDHFGLDSADISNTFYRSFRLFRIWFILQRWEGFGFRPFLTEVNHIANIQGKFKP